MNRKLLLSALAMVFGLSACSSLDGKAPAEMVKISMAHKLGREGHSYNFSSEAKMYLSDKASGVAPKVAEEADKERAAAQAGKQDKAADSAQKSDEDLSEVLKASDGGAGLGSIIADAIQPYPAAVRYIQNGRIRVNGAVDLQAKKMEVIPELEMNNRNESSKIRMPMLIDGEDLSITVDMPAIVPVAMNFVVKDQKMRERMVDQPVRFAWSDIEGETKAFPVRSAGKALLKSMYQAYNSVPADQFRAEPLDAFGKQVGARYRIDITWHDQNMQAYYTGWVQGFEAELNRLQAEGMDAGASKEGYEQAHRLAKEFQDELKDAQQKSGMSRMWGSPMQESIYLDGKGRMVGDRIYLQANGKEKALNIEMASVYSRFGHPVFTFQPQAGQVITFKELKEAFTDKEKESDNSSDTVIAEAAEEVAVVVHQSAKRRASKNRR